MLAGSVHAATVELEVIGGGVDSNRNDGEVGDCKGRWERREAVVHIARVQQRETNAFACVRFGAQLAETSASSSPDVTLATPAKPWTTGSFWGWQPLSMQHSPVDVCVNGLRVN